MLSSFLFVYFRQYYIYQWSEKYISIEQLDHNFRGASRRSVIMIIMVNNDQKLTQAEEVFVVDSVDDA